MIFAAIKAYGTALMRSARSSRGVETKEVANGLPVDRLLVLRNVLLPRLPDFVNGAREVLSHSPDSDEDLQGQTRGHLTTMGSEWPETAENTQQMHVDLWLPLLASH